MKYDVIYADPPWQFSSKRTGGSMKSGASQKYPTMTIDDLKKMPVGELASDNCYLIMWYVNAMPKEACDLAEAWGFTVKNINGLVWGKETVNGLPFFGLGYHTRAGTESALIAVKGKPKPASRSVRSFFTAPVGEHSAKPQEGRDKVEKIAGRFARKLELFHRGEPRNGWDVFGNQSAPSLILDEVGFRKPYLAEIQLQYEELEKWKKN
ncbi:TPA: MT-A70 family methyltransferase [Vibrio diabolicus]|uniref:MT-A70 family methyltransferase n=1 Tax=Vibrio harveyi group TaxID=717610 RepID=UPI0006975811|nr:MULTISPECIES: MT-A70 family methyltransferase [Vibrio harveyi group]EGQ8311273.1 adenine methylase [Vibrio parahaemolyticus]EGQ9861804.1 adenine methylase [Vibrio parahaemolyticus]EGR1221552.1 adenine methylase [Vibrio parahaemolyticus]EGR1765371.1 adenine methylase [Vibrio parahaemolyticus]EGR3219734.1 adenine methylase [Vibrio parahaemolyticus]